MKKSKYVYLLIILYMVSPELFAQYQANMQGIVVEVSGVEFAGSKDIGGHSPFLHKATDSGAVNADIKSLIADSVNYFADNGFGKPVSTMQHPAGEYYEGVTYLAYQGPHEDPYVCSYDHTTKEWTGPIQAGISALGRTPTTSDPDKIDNHGRPALIVDGQGYIHLIFGGHGGHRDLGRNPLGFNGGGKQTHVVSKKPRDISSWEVLDNIPPFGTYSQFVKTSNGNIYLFYRHGSHRSDWVYQKSVNDGRTFSDPVSILKHKQQTVQSNIYDSWYAWFQEGPDNTIICSYNYHPCANPGHSSLRINTYAMKMKTDDDAWENVQGYKLMMPLTKESADSLTIVFDSRGERTRLGTNLADSKGNPQLYFRHTSENQSILFHRWTGNEWETSRSMDPKYKFNDGDFIIENGNKLRFLLIQHYEDSDEICWWGSEDNGANWKKENSLISNTNAKFVMSALIRNAHPNARVIVAEIPTSPISVTSKLYLLGNSGPITRKK
jgi:hypothetical protein